MPRRPLLLAATLCLLTGTSGCATPPPFEPESSPAAASAAAPEAELAGTAWQLVRFQGGDDTLLTAEDPARYTLSFDASGRVAVRIDCNRGSATWQSSGPPRLEFGPLALTRAMCPPAPLTDRLTRDWAYVRSYVMREGHLFLSLMADGGIYEFARLPVQ